MTITCYMCNEPGLTKEHVPPKCLFPEAKDVDDDKNYKINLITVPSCETHNTAKSKDDLYLLFFLAASAVSNKQSEQHFSTKVMRAVQRNPHVFADFAKIHTPVIRVDDNGEKTETVAIKLDRKRFDSAIKHIAHGIYYHKYRIRFNGEITVFTECLMSFDNENSVDINEKVQIVGKRINEYLTDIPIEGSNAEIFTYQIKQDHEVNQTLIRLNFYGEFKVTSILEAYNRSAENA